MAGAAYAKPGATTFDLSVGVIIDMDEAIYMLSPTDSPLLSGVDSDGLSILSSLPTNEKQVDWLTDALLTPRSTLAAQAGTLATFLTLATGDQARFSTGDIVLVGGATYSETLEYCRVTGYGTTADTLLVTRAWTTTPAVTTLATSCTVIGIGQALAEGADPENARMQDRVQYTNVTQIFGPGKIQMSKTEQIVAKYGVPDEFLRQTFLRTKELTIHREQAYLYGKKVVDTTNKWRSMAGMYPLVTTNVDSTSTQLTVTNIQSLQQKAYNNGGVPNRLVANPIALSDLNSIGDVNRVRQSFEDVRRGRIPTMEVWTEFGPLAVVRNRWNNRADSLLFDRDQAVRRPLRPLTLERLAKTGDSDSAMLVCEETLEFKGQEHAAKFTALQYT